MTFETSKSDHFCSIPHRHCQRTPLVVVLRTGCETRPPKESKTRTLRYAFWKNYLRTVCASGSGYASADREFCSLAAQPDLSETQDSQDISSCLFESLHKTSRPVKRSQMEKLDMSSLTTWAHSAEGFSTVFFRHRFIGRVKKRRR